MVDHNQQKLTAREMVRAHSYPVLAAVSSLSLLSITVLLNQLKPFPASGATQAWSRSRRVVWLMLRPISTN